MHKTVLIFFLIIPSLYCQYSIKPQNPDFDLSFEKQSTTWSWRGVYSYNKFDSSGISVFLKDNFSTVLLRPTKSVNNWRDENNFSLKILKDLRFIDTGIYADSWILNDKQSAKDNRFSNQAAGIYAQYRPYKKLKINPYLGYQRSQTRSNMEWGWDTGAQLHLDRFQIENYTGDMQTEFDYDDYQKRRNSNLLVNLNLRTRFTDKSDDSIAVSYDKSDKQYFALGTNKLINVNLENKKIFNNLKYQVSDRSWYNVNTVFTDRTIFDDSREANKRDHLKLENRINYFRISRYYSLRIGLDTFQETRDNSDFRTDSEAKQTNIKTEILYKLSSSEDIEFKFAFSKFQFDTPDSTNYDDRDELRFIANLSYNRKFSQYLSLYLEAYSNFYHQIYLKKEQSANNNWNRIFRLSSDVTYTLDNFRNVLHNEIIANYTDYDYEEIFPETRSIVYRQYALDDSVIITLFPRVNLGLNFSIENDERGNFFSQEFLERVLQTTLTTYYNLYLNLKNFLYFNLTAGFNLYNRKDWIHIPEKRLDSHIRTISPYLRLMVVQSRMIKFHAYASRTYLEYVGQKQTSYFNGRINMAYNF